MTTPKSKVGVGTTLLLLFIITLVTGIILHLKKHGIIIQPRSVIKIIHWTAGFLMTSCACWHGIQFRKMLNAMRTKFRWFWCDTWGLILLISATLLTGTIKLLSPIKIPHLGLWHYAIGILMTIAIAIHLIRGIPSCLRLRKQK